MTDAAVREAIAKIITEVCYREGHGEFWNTYQEADRIMQLFHAQQAKAVQAARLDEQLNTRIEKLAVPCACKANIAYFNRHTRKFEGTQADRIAALQANQPPAADTTKQGEGESDE